MHVAVKSYAGQVRLSMHQAEHHGEMVDWVTVTLGPHDNDSQACRGYSMLLYSGPCSGWRTHYEQGELSRMVWALEHEAEAA